MSCAKCNDTGSLSKNIDGYLDCPHCAVAKQRTALEAWYRAVRNQYAEVDLVWLAFQRGMDEAEAQPQ